MSRARPIVAPRRFKTPVVAGHPAASINFGVCLPISCNDTALKSSFVQDLPPAIEQNERALHQALLELRLLESVYARVDMSNTTFDALAELLRNGSALAKKSGFEDLAGTLTFASNVVMNAGIAHEELDAAEAFLDWVREALHARCQPRVAHHPPMPTADRRPACARVMRVPHVDHRVCSTGTSEHTWTARAGR